MHKKWHLQCKNSSEITVSHLLFSQVCDSSFVCANWRNLKRIFYFSTNNSRKILITILYILLTTVSHHEISHCMWIVPNRDDFLVNCVNCTIGIEMRMGGDHSIRIEISNYCHYALKCHDEPPSPDPSILKTRWFLSLHHHKNTLPKIQCCQRNSLEFKQQCCILCIAHDQD